MYKNLTPNQPMENLLPPQLPLSLIYHTSAKLIRHAMKLLVNVLFTAAAATITGAVVHWRGQRDRRNVEKEAREALALAHDESRSLRQEALIRSAEKDEELVVAEETVRFLADLLGTLESDVESVVAETKEVRRRAEEARGCSEAQTADADGVSGINGGDGQPQAPKHARGRKAQEMPLGAEGGLHLASEERSSPTSYSASEGNLRRYPTAAPNAEREGPRAAISSEMGHGLALDERISHSRRAHGRGGRRGGGRGGRGGYRQARGSERGQGWRGGRGEGGRGGRGRGGRGRGGRGREGRGSRMSERGAHRGGRW